LNPVAETILWPPCPDASLGANAIHVWAASLSVPPDPLEKFSATLTPAEKERANRFKFEKHRNRFIAGRGTLRAILARYLKADAAKLHFDYLENGKPVLAEEFASAGIHFNLAHTENLALVAITRIGLVGVDVECVRPIKNVDELVARFFSPRENDLFQKVPAGEKPTAFFNLWTRKEALLKATGEGITRSLSLVEVSFLPGEPARLMAISGDEKRASEWNLREVVPAVGFTAAVAVKPETSIQSSDGDLAIKCWKWSYT
jgi:4'-phosphopantetheinyl transferase